MKKTALLLSLITTLIFFASVLGFHAYRKHRRFLEKIETGDTHYRAKEYDDAYVAYLEAQSIRTGVGVEQRLYLAEQALDPQQRAILLEAKNLQDAEHAVQPPSKKVFSIGESTTIAIEGAEAEITKGPHHYFFHGSEEFTLELRVYGYNDSSFQDVDGPISTAALMTHFFVATPLETNQALVEQYLCEQNAVEQVSLLAILAENEGVARTIDGLKSEPPGKSCANIRGRSLRLKKYLYQDKESNGTLQWTSGPLNFDPDVVILLSGIEKVYCL